MSQIYFSIDPIKNEYVAFQTPGNDPSIVFPENLEKYAEKQIYSPLPPMTHLYLGLLTVVGLYFVYRFTKI